MGPETQGYVRSETKILNNLETGKPLGIMHGVADYAHTLPVAELGTVAVSLYGFKKMLETFRGNDNESKN